MLSHFSKTDVRFWQESIFRKGYTREGQRKYTTEWYARMQHDGRRDFFPLQTPNKAAAAARARDIYLSLLINGWEPTLAKYKKGPDFSFGNAKLSCACRPWIQSNQHREKYESTELESRRSRSAYRGLCL